MSFWYCYYSTFFPVFPTHRVLFLGFDFFFSILQLLYVFIVWSVCICGGGLIYVFVLCADTWSIRIVHLWTFSFFIANSSLIALCRFTCLYVWKSPWHLGCGRFSSMSLFDLFPGVSVLKGLFLCNFLVWSLWIMWVEFSSMNCRPVVLNSQRAFIIFPPKAQLPCGLSCF